jgi:predicted AlkP superfamily phosphohydrolase/phosphomutase
MCDGDDRTLDTLLVGLDGACLPVLEPLFERGVTPTLQRLFEAGAVAPLQSQIPPWTPSAWPSLFTGVNPGRHGTYDFLSFDGYDWRLVDRNDVHEWALWELLSRRGITSVVVNVPVTFPPREFDGALVPGYVGPESPRCHPAGLLEELSEAVGGYRVYAPDCSSDAERLEWYERLTRMRGAAFRYLVRRFDPEFGFLQFQQTDTLFHERPDVEALEGVYAAVDDELERVLEAFEPATVVVASDHGMGEYDGWEFRVNDFLRAQGYVTATRRGEGMPSWTALQRKSLRGGDADGGGDQTLVERAFELGSRLGVTGQATKRVLDRVGLTPWVLRVLPTDAVRAASEQVDFAASTAYMRSRTELGVRINLAGREPEGTVPPAEYEPVREDVMAALRSARTPDGDPVFETVAPRESWFDGPYIEDAVDIVTVPAGFDHYLWASLRDEEFAPPSESWNHKLDGVVALAGEGVDPDGDLGNAHLFDVAPTVLSTLGVPPSDRMEGQTLAPVDGLPPEAYPSFAERDRQRPVRDDVVTNRLADLGYLESDHDD